MALSVYQRGTDGNPRRSVVHRHFEPTKLQGEPSTALMWPWIRPERTPTLPLPPQTQIDKTLIHNPHAAPC